MNKHRLDRFQKQITQIILLLAICYLPLAISYAAVPHLINYQGRLTDSGGTPLDGSYDLTLRIYDAEAAGNLLWEEAHSGVVIQKGIFSILLGSVTSLNLPFDKQYYLEIKVGNEVMSPRQRITSAGYAIRTETSENAIQAQNANTVANVGVSTSPAANKILPLDSNAKLPQSALGLKVYDSGWTPITINTTYSFNHNLNTTKILVNVYISNTNDNSGWVITHWNLTNPNYNDQTMIVRLTSTQIKIRTTDAYICKFRDENGNDQAPTSGYIRIVALALE